MEIMLEHLGKGLWLCLLLSLPAVLVAAGIGLIVGILQAVTQVQEQTIAAAPKILAVFLLIILGGGLMMQMLEDYTREGIFLAFNAVPQADNYLLPPKPKSPGQIRAQAFFKTRQRLLDIGKVKTVFQQSGPNGATQTSHASSTGLLNNGQSQSLPKPSLPERLMMQRQAREER